MVAVGILFSSTPRLPHPPYTQNPALSSERLGARASFAGVNWVLIFGLVSSLHL